MRERRNRSALIVIATLRRRVGISRSKEFASAAFSDGETPRVRNVSEAAGVITYGISINGN
jgi:hypothetical protein